MRWSSVAWCLFVLAACASAVGARAHAQTLRGWVLDDGNGRPVRGASVSVLHIVRDTVLAARITDERPFEIFMREPGNYRLRVEAFGYATLTTEPVRLPEEMVVTLELRLRANAIALAPLRVLAERVEAPFMRDVRARQASGFGRVLTRDDLEPLTGGKLQDVLVTLPGVRVAAYDFAGRSIPLVETRASVAGVGECFASIYLNGIRQFEMRADVVTGTGLDPDLLARVEDMAALSVSDIEAVEIYRGAAELPPEFSGSTSQCGVVAIWTRMGYDPPLPARERPHLTVSVAAAGLHVSGAEAPDAGYGPEFGLYWRRSDAVAIGLRLHYSVPRLPAAATHALTQRLDPAAYRLPPGKRSLPLYIGGLETRVAIVEGASYRALLSARLNAARRSFSVLHTHAGSSKYASSAFGFGGSAGAELYLSDRLTADAVVGHDWLFFRSYERLDRPQDPTSATWRALSLRLGFSLVAARGAAR